MITRDGLKLVAEQFLDIAVDTFEAARRTEPLLAPLLFQRLKRIVDDVRKFTNDLPVD